MEGTSGIERPKSASGVSITFVNPGDKEASSSIDNVPVKPSTSPQKIVIAVGVGVAAVIILASVVIPIAVIYGNNDNNERNQAQDQTMGSTTYSPRTTWSPTKTTPGSSTEPDTVTRSTTKSLTGTTGSGTAETTTSVNLSTTGPSAETTSGSGSTSTPAELVGSFTEWGSWTTCTATCGFGTYKRYRQCISPNGETCTGDRIQLEICPIEACPVHGKWSTWSEWGTCDRSCGNGSQTRTRVCSKVNVISDLDCVGDVSQSQQCSTWACPDCSQSCDVGYLNDECDTCICNSTVIRGRVIAESTGFGLGDANIFAASAPTRLLTSSNSTGFFSLTTMCTTSELFVSRDGFLNQAVKVNQTDLIITMTFIVQPHFQKTPQSKNRLSGENVTLCCEAEGVPNITYYEWFRNTIILDKSLYPEGVTLYLEDVTAANNGIYKCRANSPVGTKMSTDAQLQVKDSPNDFCADALVERAQTLPDDCIQPSTNTATYEVGECISKSCRLNGSIDENSCHEDESSCCTAGQTEMKTVQCSGYSLDIFVIMSCSCASCTSGSLKVFGTVTGNDTNDPLVFGEVWVNNYRVTYTSISGSYSLIISKQTNEIVLAFLDTFYRKFLPTTKVIQITDQMSGTIKVDVILAKAADPIEISSYETNMMLVSSAFGNSSTGANFSIPANSFFNQDGSKYEGTVSATITFLDPSDPSDGTYLPANFEFIDEEGETGNLASLGVFNFFFQDSDGNDLDLNSSIGVYLPDDIAASVSEDDFKLWILDEGTGKWELMSLSTSGGITRRRRRDAKTVIGSIDPSQITRHKWFNIDKILEEEKCFIKVRIFEDSKLTEEIKTFNRPVWVEQHWTEGSVFSTYWVTYLFWKNFQYGYCGQAACNDIYGFITASHGSYRHRKYEFLFPGDVTDFSYEIDGRSTRVDFSRTLNGPLFSSEQACMASDPATSRYVSFHYGITEVTQFTSNEFFELSFPLTLEKRTLSDMTWYVNRSPGEGYRVCYMKIKLEFQPNFQLFTGETMKLRLTSKGGTAERTLGKIFGIREIQITDTSTSTTVCVEYKCSGTISPQIELTPPEDNTNVIIEVKGTNFVCSVNSQSTFLADNWSQIGNIVVDFNAPVTPTPDDHGMYRAITDNGKDEIDNKRIEAEQTCKSGKEQYYDQDNPDIGLALTMYCQRCNFNCP